MKILLIHGPNLNLLGTREVNVYGADTIEMINKEVSDFALSLNVFLEILQSNHEGDIVDIIGSKKDDFDGILINPAAYTHTSVAIRDAISAVTIPSVEVHLSNIYAREEFRKESLIAPVCIGQISGFGTNAYLLGLQALVHHVKEQNDE